MQGVKKKKKQTNIHVYPTNLKHASRIFRVTTCISEYNYFDQILLIGIQENNSIEIEKIDSIRTIYRLKTICKHNSKSAVIRSLASIEWFVRVLVLMYRVKPSLINAHNITSLPLAVFYKFLKRRTKIVYEPHELETETNAKHGLKKAFAKWMERTFIKNADKVVVVGNMIAEWYEKEYSIAKPYVILNLPDVELVINNSIDLKGKLGIERNDLLFIHQGLMIKGRGIERIIGIFKKVNKKNHILFLGNGELDSIIEKECKIHSNFHKIDLVKSNEVLNYTVGADVGIGMLIRHAPSLSNEYSVGNKFFEYLSAGIPVLVNSFPEYKRIVEKYNCGWIADNDDNAVVEFINGLDFFQIESKKENVRKAANDFQWSNEKKKLESIYADLLS